MNIVEGYVVNPENEWCNPFALGEPKYSTKVQVFKHFNQISPFSGETKTTRKSRVCCGGNK